jgi:hypothetical protein
MSDEAIEEERIWATLEATKETVFRLLSRSVQLLPLGER